MKRLCVLVLLLFCALFGAQAKPAAEFLQKSYQLGRIDEKGGVVSRTYTFRNTGDTPLVVTGAETSCTCTKASFSKKPVLPGAEGTITVTYNPRNQHGVFQKAISIYTNVSGVRYIVTLSGEVVVE